VPTREVTLRRVGAWRKVELAEALARPVLA